MSSARDLDMCKKSLSCEVIILSVMVYLVLELSSLALLCTTVAHTWNIHLLRRLTAYTANLTMNFEPVWGILLGAILFHEYQQLHLAFYLGTVFIIVANFLDPWLKKRRESSPDASTLNRNRN